MSATGERQGLVLGVATAVVGQVAGGIGALVRRVPVVGPLAGRAGSVAFAAGAAAVPLVGRAAGVLADVVGAVSRSAGGGTGSAPGSAPGSGTAGGTAAGTAEPEVATGGTGGTGGTAGTAGTAGGTPTPVAEADLPVPGWDARSAVSLRPSVRALDLDQLEVMREWERAHAARPPVLEMLDERVAELATQPGAGDA